jgi:chromosome segregation ATPase
MWGFGWLITLLEFFTKFLHGNRGDAEPLIDGYGDLTGGQQHFINNLEERITEVEKINRKLLKAMRIRRRRTRALEEKVRGLTTENVECEKRCAELTRRVAALEDKAKQERDYAHDHVHEFEEFMSHLTKDLEVAGIEPAASASVLRRVRERQVMRDTPHDRPTDASTK